MKALQYLSILFLMMGLLASIGCKKAPTCNDGIQNQGERGIDCSGPCSNEGKICNCFNGIQDGEETGIDCGGPYCACCDEPCDRPTASSGECLEMPADTAFYKINNGQLSSSKPNAYINQNDNLGIDIPFGGGEKTGITQTKLGFNVGEFNVKNSGITFVTATLNDVFYSSQVAGSDGKVMFTEFVYEIDCKYVSGTYDVTLFNQSREKSLQLSGDFSEVIF